MTRGSRTTSSLRGVLPKMDSEVDSWGGFKGVHSRVHSWECIQGKEFRGGFRMTCGKTFQNVFEEYMGHCTRVHIKILYMAVSK